MEKKEPRTQPWNWLSVLKLLCFKLCGPYFLLQPVYSCLQFPVAIPTMKMKMPRSWLWTRFTIT